MKKIEIKVIAGMLLLVACLSAGPVYVALEPDEPEHICPSQDSLNTLKAQRDEYYSIAKGYMEINFLLILKDMNPKAFKKAELPDYLKERYEQVR